MARVRRTPGWRVVELTGTRLRLPAGVELDLGATAKAVAADRCAGAVADALGVGVLVSLGGDIATAGPGPPGGWQVLVQDTPTDPAAHLGLLGGTAVATSSSVRRTWRRGAETAAPRGRPPHLAPRPHAVAHRQRGGGDLCGGQRRRHRHPQPGPRRPTWLGRPGPARPAGRPRPPGPPARWLAPGGAA